MTDKRNIHKIRSTKLNGPAPLFERGLSIIHPYFGEVTRFNFMYENYWSRYSDRIKQKLHIVLVDDCGTPPIHTLMTNRSCDFNLTIYRILDDLRYNTAGALNLGSIKAPTDVIFHLDSDCAVEPAAMEKVLDCNPEVDYMYKFQRNRITNNPERKKLTRYLPCANLLHKELFYAVHGFDEDFTGSRSGGYGFFDNHFDHKVIQAGYGRAVLKDIIVTEYLETLVEPKKPTGPLGVGVHRTDEHNAINKRLYRAKQKGVVPNSTEILRFKYEKVYEHTI